MGAGLFPGRGSSDALREGVHLGGEDSGQGPADGGRAEEGAAVGSHTSRRGWRATFCVTGPRSTTNLSSQAGPLVVDGLRRLVVHVTLSRRVDPRQAGDEYRDEQSSDNLFDHAYAARRPRERRHVSETSTREHSDAQVERIGIDQSSGCPTIMYERG